MFRGKNGKSNLDIMIKIILWAILFGVLLSGLIFVINKRILG